MMTSRFKEAFRPPVLLAIVLVLAAGAGGVFLFFHLRDKPPVDPAPQPPPVTTGTPPKPPPIVVAVVAHSAGLTPEEIERQVTIPLETAVAGMPRLKVTRSQSLPGLARLSVQFEDGSDYGAGRQEVANRLQPLSLPADVQVQLQPASSAVLLRYTLSSPSNAAGQNLYTLHDLRSLQDGVVARQLLRVPGVAGVVGSGGAVKRYEVQPDPDRLRRFGVTLPQLEKAIADTKCNVAGLGVRDVGLFGPGGDPLGKASALKDARAAAALLRAEEAALVREIRQVVVARVNKVAVRVGDVVEGGPLAAGDTPGRRGVVVGRAPHGDRVDISHRADTATGWIDEERVHGVVLLRRGEDAASVLRAVQARVRELNDTPGRLLPGVRIEPYEVYTAGEGESDPEKPLWVHCSLPVGLSLDQASRLAGRARGAMRNHPELGAIVSQVGSPQDALSPVEPNTVRFCMLLQRANAGAPAGRDRTRNREQLRSKLEDFLRRGLGGMEAWVGRGPQDDSTAFLAAAPAGHVVKIYGPDLQRLESLAARQRE
jgi:Cu/Ag efflux pump CusA